MQTRHLEAALLLVGLLSACRKEKDEEPPPTPPIPIAAAADDGNETAKLLVARYKIACDAVVGDWGACHDEPKTYDALIACTEDLLARAKAARDRYPKTEASTPCAREVDAAMRSFLAYHPQWLEENLAWLKKAKPKIAPLMRGGPNAKMFGDFCQAGEKTDPCLGKPTDEKTDWSVINTVACTKNVLVCGDAGNVCDLPKATTRMGLECGSKGAAKRPVLSRATGRAVPY